MSSPAELPQTGLTAKIGIEAGIGTAHAQGLILAIIIVLIILTIVFAVWDMNRTSPGGAGTDNRLYRNAAIGTGLTAFLLGGFASYSGYWSYKVGRSD